MVAKALSPAKVNQVNISDDGTAADVIVPDHQLSLAIGREGQNARLSARLTGVRVDIRSETQVAEGVPAGSYATRSTSSTPRASGWRTPSPARWSGTPPTARVISQAEWIAQTTGDEPRRATDRGVRRRAADASPPSRRSRSPTERGAGRPPPSEPAEASPTRTPTDDAAEGGIRRSPPSADSSTESPTPPRVTDDEPSDQHAPIRTCVGCRRRRRPELGRSRCVLDGRADDPGRRSERGSWCLAVRRRRRAGCRAGCLDGAALATVRSSLAHVARPATTIDAIRAALTD